MKNTLLKIEYKGTRYSGWQVQPGVITIQQELQSVLKQICQSQVTLKVCSRTDAGVHARGQLATVLIPDRIPLAKLLRSINSLLPDDIAVTDLIEVTNEFNIRHAVSGKRYIYQIINSAVPRVFASETFLWIKST